LVVYRVTGLCHGWAVSFGSSHVFGSSGSVGLRLVWRSLGYYVCWFVWFFRYVWLVLRCRTSFGSRSFVWFWFVLVRCMVYTACVVRSRLFWFVYPLLLRLFVTTTVDSLLFVTVLRSFVVICVDVHVVYAGPFSGYYRCLWFGSYAFRYWICAFTVTIGLVFVLRCSTGGVC